MPLMSPAACAFHCSSVGRILGQVSRSCKESGGWRKHWTFCNISRESSGLWDSSNVRRWHNGLSQEKEGITFHGYTLRWRWHWGTENCSFLGYYAASSGNFLPTFRDNLSVPNSGFKNPKESLLPQNRLHTGKIVGGDNQHRRAQFTDT